MKTDLILNVNEKDGWVDSDPLNRLEYELDENESVSFLKIERPSFKGVIEKTQLVMHGDFEVEKGRDLVLGAVLRTVLSVVFEERRMLFLHASAVKRNGKLWVFFGPSGAGKSTIAAKLNDGGVPFSSDRVVLELKEDGKIWAHSTPFSDHDRVITKQEPCMVDGFVRIHQATENSLVKMNTIKTIKSLFYESLVLTKRQSVYDKLLEITGAVAKKGICFEMGFKKDTSFWELLDNSLQD
ncbi:MAG: hypothetical protein JXR91_14940 [Deltaproteobacteria bacterium]|nr:hypothetical protein [Deltaproteobacteria bacterium]